MRNANRGPGQAFPHAPAAPHVRASGREPYVFHFVLTQPGQLAERGERLATLCLPAADVARLGLPAVRHAVELERRHWSRIVRSQFPEDRAVNVVTERGFVRSLFPAAALAAIIPAPRPAILLPPARGNAGGSATVSPVEVPRGLPSN